MKKLALELPDGYNIEPPAGFEFTGGSIGQVIGALLPVIFSIAGLLLFGLLIWGGFEFLTSAGDPKKVESAKSRLTSAFAGFVIIFVAYWLIQILEVIFGIRVF